MSVRPYLFRQQKGEVAIATSDISHPHPLSDTNFMDYLSRHLPVDPSPVTDLIGHGFMIVGLGTQTCNGQQQQDDEDQGSCDPPFTVQLRDVVEGRRMGYAYEHDDEYEEDKN